MGACGFPDEAGVVSVGGRRVWSMLEAGRCSLGRGQAGVIAVGG